MSGVRRRVLVVFPVLGKDGSGVCVLVRRGPSALFGEEASPQDHRLGRRSSTAVRSRVRLFPARGVATTVGARRRLWGVIVCDLLLDLDRGDAAGVTPRSRQQSRVDRPRAGSFTGEDHPGRCRPPCSKAGGPPSLCAGDRAGADDSGFQTAFGPQVGAVAGFLWAGWRDRRIPWVNHPEERPAADRRGALGNVKVRRW